MEDHHTPKFEFESVSNRRSWQNIRARKTHLQLSTYLHLRVLVGRYVRVRTRSAIFHINNNIISNSIHWLHSLTGMPRRNMPMVELKQQLYVVNLVMVATTTAIFVYIWVRMAVCILVHTYVHAVIVSGWKCQHAAAAAAAIKQARQGDSIPPS